MYVFGSKKFDIAVSISAVITGIMSLVVGHLWFALLFFICCYHAMDKNCNYINDKGTK